MVKTPMTSHGAEALKEELLRLKSIERPKVIQAIAEARAHGDLKENAEYSAAKESQGFIEGRIAEIESKLSTAQIIDIKNLPKTGKVVFGATVALVNLNTDQTVSYQIVGDDEADIREHKISINSPIARAVIGRSKGDVTTVKAPGGEVEYEVLSVAY